ncbi:hypothetical protein [Clostridium beijerinckii]|uniref:hypothetical protein n=1 Tax=Clostridium beijerinckii TaxID=1520 RepID=UPI0004792482|nr:hypothetical protein [Clostridium beijerinckii]
MRDIETAKSESTLLNIATELKQNIHLAAQAGIPVIPLETKSMGEVLEKDIIAMYRKMLNSDFTIGMDMFHFATFRIPLQTTLFKCFFPGLFIRFKIVHNNLLM